MPHLKCFKNYIDNKYDLRWRLDYHNKPPKMGMWCKSKHDDPYTLASCQDRGGLITASIEAKERTTRKIKTMIICSASDYVQHRWIAAGPAPTAKFGVATIEGSINGMTLVTRDFKVHVLIDGTIIKQKMNERRSTYA